MWVGTFANGVNILDAARQRFTAYPHNPLDVGSLSSNRVIDIFRDRSGLFWVATEGGGVNQYNPQQQVFTLYGYDPGDANSLASDTIQAVYEDPEGILWLGTQERGLVRFDRQTGQMRRYLPDPTNRYSSAFRPSMIFMAIIPARYGWRPTAAACTAWIQPPASSASIGTTPPTPTV